MTYKINPFCLPKPKPKPTYSVNFAADPEVLIAHVKERRLIAHLWANPFLFMAS